MTEGLAVAGAIDRFFNSVRNNHVLHNHERFLESCRKIYEDMEKLDLYEKAISKVAIDGLSANFIRYLRILHEPDGWMRVNLPLMSSYAVTKTFLYGG